RTVCWYLPRPFSLTLTELAAEAWNDPAKSAPMMVRHPLQRFAEAEDVAQSIALLLSDDSSMISGAVLPIDGGFLAV
ncbi:MAG: SDR family oxidoreductase, partial [Rhizobium oryzihabitans]